MYPDLRLFIGGAWRDATGGATRPVTDPATEEVLGTMATAGEADIDAALAAAREGFAVWRQTGTWDRARILRRTADLIRERSERIATLMSLETGKPIAEARAETGTAADQFEWYAEETKRIYGQIIEGRSRDVRMAVIYQPVGVVAAFTAWNFPALLPARKIAAALAAGCSVIVKPAGESPASCAALVEACADAGVPAGAVNFLTGSSDLISRRLIAAPEVRKVSLTGSVPVGKELLRLAADGVKKVSMELGGHAPVLVFPDADPAAAGEACARVKFRNAGQVCISPTRFYVHEDVCAPFAAAFATVARSLKIGRGLDDGVQMGPLANRRGLDGIRELVADALGRGAELLAGGKVPGGINRGYFYEPTVLGRVPDDARVMVEEPFGPIAPITPFRSYDEVMARANALPFGLAGYLFTNGLSLATRAAEDLEVGMVGVNDLLLATAEAPFGGIKESGMGREGGSIGILDYVEPKYIRTRLRAGNG
ncbi:MAG: NAD-dependent succinate-semialdehyde dehydrogenase [Rhodobacteraceae bacterium]|jgi:succinate-semialdehyde dehydrogenase/glutarate-semialdehyde dehydrogenase|nr:NAD-dependent succinate-semialdehyde dehydrogenase [Paracoccaceae bacterium]